MLFLRIKLSVRVRIMLNTVVRARILLQSLAVRVLICYFLR